MNRPYQPLTATVPEPDGVTPACLIKAGTLLRLAATASSEDASLFERLASLCANRGAEQALVWLDGFWYSTGTRRHEAITNAQFILSLAI